MRLSDLPSRETDSETDRGGRGSTVEHAIHTLTLRFHTSRGDRMLCNNANNAPSEYVRCRRQSSSIDLQDDCSLTFQVTFCSRPFRGVLRVATRERRRSVEA